jgi:PD-(D/E)XK nuclease superfamily
MAIYNPQDTKPFKLSRSKVELYINCPRCFYLDRRLKVGQPPGFPFNLNSAVDSLLKNEFDFYRQNKEPHPYMVEMGIDAIPYQDERLDIWRQNFIGVSYLHPETNFHLFGAVDDLWIDNKTGEIIVVDYKSTSKAGVITINEPWQAGYRRQMEFYQWLLRQNGLKVSNKGWFVYCNGIKEGTFNNQLDFNVSLLDYTGNGDWIEPTITSIKKCLNSDKIPDAHDECEYCMYASQYNNVINK